MVSVPPASGLGRAGGSQRARGDRDGDEDEQRVPESRHRIPLWDAAAELGGELAATSRA